MVQRVAEKKLLVSTISLEIAPRARDGHFPGGESGKLSVFLMQRLKPHSDTVSCNTVAGLSV